MDKFLKALTEAIDEFFPVAQRLVRIRRPTFVRPTVVVRRNGRWHTRRAHVRWS